MKKSRKQRDVKPEHLIYAAGMVTVSEPWLISTGKNAWVENVYLAASRRGTRVLLKPGTRPGTRRITSSALPGELVAHKIVKGIHFVTTTTGIYYLDETFTPQNIGTIEGRPELEVFGGKLILADGGYLESVDPVTKDHGVAWDVDGYMWSELSKEASGDIHMDNAITQMSTNALITPAFGPGTIPLNTIKLYAGITGAPTGNATVQLLAEDGATLLASGTFDVANLPTSGVVQVEVPLTEAPGQTFKTPQSIVRVVQINFTGTATDYLRINYIDGTDGIWIYTVGSGWAEDTTKELRIAVSAGLPPKASTLAVNLERLFAAGGDWADSEDRSKLHYSDAANLYSWGARQFKGGSAGYWGVDRQDGGEITQVAPYFFDLYIFKGNGEKSIHVLTGSGDPTEWARRRIFANEGTLAPRSVANVGDNIFYLDQEVLGLQGIEGYGDVRKYPRSRDIQNYLDDFGDENAFAVYDRRRDLYLIQLAGIDTTLVYHAASNQWAAWTMVGYTPTCFNHQDGETYLGGSDGHLYAFDETIPGFDAYDVSTESGQEWQATIRGPMRDFGNPTTDKQIISPTLEVSARVGATGEINFRKDYAKEDVSQLARDILIPPDSDVTVGEMDWTVGEWQWPWKSTGKRLQRYKVNFVCKMAQASITLNPAASKIWSGPLKAQVARLGSN